MNITSNTTKAIVPATAPAITPIELEEDDDVSDCADAVVAILRVKGCVVVAADVVKPVELGGKLVLEVIEVLDVGLKAVDVLVVELLVVGFRVLVSRVEVVEEVVVEVVLRVVVAFAECK
jgi:hypothetical protein